MFPRLSELSAAIAKPVAVQEDAQLDEGRMSGLVDKWMDYHKIYSFEGSRGEQRFEKLIRTIGYRDMSEFFGDNSGALDALVAWISKQNATEWEEKMKADLPGDDDDQTDED